MKKPLIAITLAVATVLSVAPASATLPPPPTRAPDSFPAMTGAFDTNALWTAAQQYAINTSYAELRRVMQWQGNDDRALISVSYNNPWEGIVGNRHMITMRCEGAECRNDLVLIQATAPIGVYAGYGNTRGPSAHAAANFNPVSMVAALEAQGITPATLGNANLSFLGDYAALTRSEWMEAKVWQGGANCPAIDQALASLEGLTVPVDFTGIGDDHRGDRYMPQGFNEPVIKIATRGGGDQGLISIGYGQSDGVASRVMAALETIKTACTAAVEPVRGPA